MNGSVLLITELPKCILQAILIDWIPIEAICKLDSALCNHRLRAEYLKQNVGTIFEGMPVSYLQHCNPYFIWSISRGILTRAGDVTVDMMPLTVQRILHHNSKVLDWLSCHNFDPENAQKFTTDLCESNCKLSKLHILGGDWNDSFPVLLSQQSSLRKLSLTNSASLASTSFAGISVLYLHTLSIVDTNIPDDAAATLAPLLATHLRKLHIKNTSRVNYNIISDEGLQHFAVHCTKLVVLGVVNNVLVSDTTIVQFASSCVSLSYVDISGCRLLTDASLTAIAAHNPLLERLYIHTNSNYTVTGLGNIASNCALLDTLHCAECNRMSFEAIGLIMAKCPKMCALYFGMKISWDENIAGVQVSWDESIVSLLHRCTKLVKLCIFNPTASFAVLQAISTHCTQLNDLGFHNASKLNPEGLFLVAKRCTELELLLSRNSVVTPLEKLFWNSIIPKVRFTCDEKDMLNYNILVEL